jgi:hypothetical protein
MFVDGLSQTNQPTNPCRTSLLGSLSGFPLRLLPRLLPRLCLPLLLLLLSLLPLLHRLRLHLCGFPWAGHSQALRALRALRALQPVQSARPSA